MANFLMSKYKLKIFSYRAKSFLLDIIGRRGERRRARVFSVFAVLFFVALIASISVYGLNLRGSAVDNTKISATPIVNQAAIYLAGDNTFHALQAVGAGEEIRFVFARTHSGGISTGIASGVVTNKKIYEAYSSNFGTWQRQIDYTSVVKDVIGGSGGTTAAYFLVKNNSGRTEMYGADDSNLFIRLSTTSTLEGDLGLSSTPDILMFTCSSGNTAGGTPQCLITYKDSSGGLKFIEWADGRRTFLDISKPPYFSSFPASMFSGQELVSTALHSNELDVILKDSLNKKSYANVVGTTNWQDKSPKIYALDPIVHKGLALHGNPDGSSSGETLVSAQDPTSYLFTTWNGPGLALSKAICKVYDSMPLDVNATIFAFDNTCDPSNPVPPAVPPTPSPTPTVTNLTYDGVSIHTKARNISRAEAAYSATAKKGMGDIIEFTLTVSNAGSAAATTDVKFTLPSGFTFGVMVSGAGAPTGPDANGNLTWTGYSAPVGESKIVFTTKAP